MTTVAIDPDRARATGRRLVDVGDELYAGAVDWRPRLEELHLSVLGLPARRLIERAATAWWEAGTFLHLLADAVAAADGFDPGSAIAIGHLREIASGLTGRHGPLGAIRDLFGASRSAGEVGGTFDAELRTPYAVFGATPLARARALLARALTDTGDGRQIRPDEFELVQLANDVFVVVLPGVTDLSRPDPLLSDENRTVRDLDQHAVPSSRSTSVTDNRYAQLVWDALVRAGVPAGAQLLIVGHSFGADTALDLASDPDFNGSAGFEVSHVVAAGYHSRPQLPDVPAATEVLVLQNDRDAAVIAEVVGRSHAVGAVESQVSQWTRLLSGDVVGAARASIESFEHQVGAVLDVAEFGVDHADDLGDLVAGAVTGDVERASSALDGLITLETGTERVDGHIVVDVFDGGAAGVGHHPSNYVERIERTDEPLVLEYLASVAAAGFAGSGSAVAIDISEPSRQ